MTDPIRVLIVDDQGMVRTGFAAFLSGQADIEVVGEAADGRQAIERAASLAPHVILMDVRMPGLDGLAATRAILSGDPPPGGHPRVVVLTTFDLDEYVYDALKAGASGFLLKDASAVELADAVRVVARGDAVIAPAITRRLIADFAAAGGRRAATPARVAELTDRESEVLVLVAHGMSNGEIAGELVLAEQTVKTHVSRILMKLDLRDRAQAIVFAYESGLVEPGR
ncbi:response regulator [Euzebya sp.]|uniref:response regulator n=1 Tax=Euzebya sp. TaxID=1971409 RepID=UPI0035122002